jgi:D-alanine-D-alanine ligase
MKVGLSFNLKNSTPQSGGDDLFAEWDDEETIEAVRSALALRHHVMLIEGNEEAFEKFRKFRPDIVFNMAEGIYGSSRESQIPAMLEMLQIPYTGSGPLTLALCLDKARAKEVLRFHGLPTAPFAIVGDLQRMRGVPPFPVIVKPLFEGSSKGIANDALVRSPKQLREQVSRILTQYRQPALVEKFLPGREFTVALLGNEPPVRVLPIVEIQLEQLPEKMNPIYSYEAKWIWDTVQRPLQIFTCPAKLPQRLRKKIEAISQKAFQVMGCRDWCRIDIRLDEFGEPQILELNPLPGILPNPDANSCFPKAARTAGVSYEELIHRVLDIACRRIGLAR